MRAAAKAAFEAREGVKLSFLPFFALATVEALKAHPNVNASIDLEAGTVTYHDAVHLGIAVDTDRGLLVPVINHAEDLNIGGLARKIADLADRTRSNKVSPDELGGGTFTLTNTGSRGALFDTPIINQPQVGILGTGAVVKRPVVVATPGPRRDDRDPVDGLLRPDLRPPPGRRCRRAPASSAPSRPGSRTATSTPSSAWPEHPHHLSAPARHASTCRAEPSWQDDGMRIVISGSSGLLGSALVPALEEAGHSVVRLVRHPPTAPAEVEWDPSRGPLDPQTLADADAVINLSGAPVAGHRWSPQQKQLILSSRVEPTRTLALALAAAEPRPRLLLSASAIGAYGETGEAAVDERTPLGEGYFPSVVRAWEAATAPAEQAGVRVLHLRTGLVLTARGGLLGRAWRCPWASSCRC